MAYFKVTFTRIKYWGGKWGGRGREAGEMGEGSGGKGGGNWECGTPLSTPSSMTTDEAVVFLQ